MRAFLLYNTFQTMKLRLLIFWSCGIAILLILLQACTEKPDLLEGKWERFDDQAAGAMIKVEHKGDVLQGMLFQVTGELANLGFVVKDIKWKDIKKKDDNYYTGLDLQKAVNANGEVAKSDYVEVYFELISDDILEISSFAKSTEFFGTRQKWKRIE